MVPTKRRVFDYDGEKLKIPEPLLVAIDIPEIEFRSRTYKNPKESGAQMKNARQLLEEFIATSFRDPKQAASMFTADGTFEMPYLEDLGFPASRSRSG
jgi:hypothetical protein